MDNSKSRILVNFVPREGEIITCDKDNGGQYVKTPFRGIQANGFYGEIYSNYERNIIYSQIVSKSIEFHNEMNEDELESKIRKTIDPNIYKAIQDYEFVLETEFATHTRADDYVEIMLQEVERLSGESDKAYKERVNKLKKEQLADIGIFINYDLRGLMFAKLPLKAKLKMLDDAKENAGISSKEHIKIMNNLSEEYEDDLSAEDDVEALVEKVRQEAARKNKESLEESFKKPEVPENGESIEPLSEEASETNSANETEEFNTELELGVFDGVVDKDYVISEKFEELSAMYPDDESAHTPTQNVETSKVFEELCTLYSDEENEDVKKDNSRFLKAIKSKASGMMKSAKSFGKAVTSAFDRLTVKSSEKLSSTYTTAKGTIDKLKKAAESKEHRKNIAKKIAVAGIMSAITIGALTTAMNRTGKILDKKAVGENNSKASSSYSMDFESKDNMTGTLSGDRVKVLIEDSEDNSKVEFELPAEESNIDLKESLSNSIEDNIGIGSTVKLTEGSYYADPTGNGTEYKLENFTAKYGNEFEISRVNIVTEDGRNVQVNMKNGSGMTYSEIKAMYPNCTITATHLSKGNMQVGWLPVNEQEIAHSILNDMDLSKEAKDIILNSEDGKITESEKETIEASIKRNAGKTAREISSIRDYEIAE